MRSPVWRAFGEQYNFANGKDTLVITHVGRSTQSAPDKRGAKLSPNVELDD